MTLYDGTGTRDLFYPAEFRDSPALAGARNVAYDDAQGMLGGGYGHLELATHAGPLETMIEWLREAGEPLPDAEPPALRFEDGHAVTDADASVHCASGGAYPTRESGPTQVEPGRVQTCFAHSERSGLSSPMARFAAPPLTTVLQDTKLAGELLVDTLLAQIQGEEVTSRMLPAALVVRQSCGVGLTPSPPMPVRPVGRSESSEPVVLSDDSSPP